MFDQLKNLLTAIYCKYFTVTSVSYETTFITKSGTFAGEGGCSFKNIGQVDCTINGFPLLAGDPMISYPVERWEKDNTKYKIVFDAASVLTKQVVMIRKNRG